MQCVLLDLALQEMIEIIIKQIFSGLSKILETLITVNSDFIGASPLMHSVSEFL